MIFPQLAHWSSAAVAAQNAMIGLFPSTPDWENAMRSALGAVLRYPAGYRLHLAANHRLDTKRPPIAAVVDGTEATIGRGEQCGLLLPEAAIRREHTRVMIHQGLAYVEDLGSPLGTFIGDRKLAANAPEPLAPGAEFTIFPYRVQARVEQLWTSDSRLFLAPPASGWRTWADVPRDRLIGCTARLEPGPGQVWLGVNTGLIREALRGVYGVEVDMAGLLETDAGCLDFILNSCLERFNSEFQWPWRLEWQRWGGLPPFQPKDRGLLMETAVKLRETSGAVSLFLPESTLPAIPRKSAVQLPAAFGALPVPCWWQLSAVELSSSEAASLAEGDTILIDAEPRLILHPGAAGWKCEAEGDNFSRFRLDKPLERMERLSIDTTSAMAELPQALAEVPVLLQVILARKSFTLGELRTLSPGAVIDLERDETALVELAVNGKVMGTGELVRIDGQLGVKVMGWNS